MAKPAIKAVSKEKAVATLSGVNTAVTAFKLPEGARVKRVVTLPSLVMKTIGEARCLFIGDAMRASTVVTKKLDASGNPEKPATVCGVTDTETGEQFIFLVPAVVKSGFEQNYPNDDYVGKCFLIENLGKRKDGQRHTDFRIIEVEYPDA